MERMFAAPFIAQLGKGHVDSVFSMTVDPESLSRVASGSADGVVKIWDLTSREEMVSLTVFGSLRETCHCAHGGYG